jgi:ribulose-phosphate 3-epimerase
VTRGDPDLLKLTAMTDLKVAASLLAADYVNLGDEVASVEGVVDWLHLDVMDGHFVPNITFGMPVIAALRPVTSLRFDCHLMTTNPDAYLGELAGAGADLVTMHIEAVADPTPAAEKAREHGLDFGLVLNPGTPFEAIEPFAELCDVILLMTVEPGFGGQSLIESVLGKVERAREWVEERGLATDIEVDGGIALENAGLAISAGANVLVAGTAIFGAAEPREAAANLRRAMENND